MEIKTYLLKLKLFAGLAAVLVLASCTKESINSSANLPVVEAYLMPGNAILVKLYQQKSLSDTAKYGAAITGLKVYVSDGDKKIQLTESPAGTYTYSDQSFLEAGKTYTMQFNYLTYTVSAKTIMPAKPLNFATQYGTIHVSSSSSPNGVIDTLDRLTWQNPDSLNHVLVFKNSDGRAFPLNNFGGNRPVDFELNTSQSSVYYITPNIFPYYGHYQVILLRVNQEYIDLLKSNTSNSTSQNLATIPSNIVNGYGIFTAMQADTVALNVFN
jgi:hypothetical protein